MDSFWRWLGLGKKEEAKVNQPEREPKEKTISPYARENRGPLNQRPGELADALVDLRKRLSGKRPLCLVEVAQETKEELDKALQPLGIPLVFFQREEYVAIAILEIKDLSMLDFLMEDWLLNYPCPTVTFSVPC